MESTPISTEAPRRAGRKGSVNRLDPDGTHAAEEQREVAREPARKAAPTGRQVVYGRDGKPISRRRDNTMDQFEIPRDIREGLEREGWDLQWNVKTVLGQENIAQQMRDMEAGWRPIMADREEFKGRFMPDGWTGPIERDGLILCERPMQLTEEARREDRINANAQRADNRRRFGLPDLPAGFEDRQDLLGRVGKGKPGVNIALEGAPGREGKYQMAIDGDE